MASEQTTPIELTRSIPGGYGNRLFLFVVRRMASDGVNDAHAANAMLGAFGKSYRRPLILMRAMMLELARVSSRRIMVAPCCCARMTGDEALVITAIGQAIDNPPSAYARLTDLLDNDQALGALTCLQAVAQSFCDLGRPLQLYGAG